MELRRKIGKNDKGGRDFVIGDLHGCYQRLMQFMEFIKFDKEKDRIFSVGDLVDRGPQNLECLMLIYEPWFFAVRGNHEQLMGEYMDKQPYGTYWSFNGGGWGTQYREEQSDLAMQVRDAAKKANEQPVMMTVEKQDGTFFHVIHAELAGVKPLSDKLLENEEEFEEAAFHQSVDGDFIIWGRYLFNSLYAKQLNDQVLAKYQREAKYHKMGAIFSRDLSHIYSGHTIVQHPVRFMGQTNIDTGAFRSIFYDNGPYGAVRVPEEWAGLTVTEPLTDRFWKVTERGVEETKPIILA